LGPPLWQGGDGTAERRYLESVALVVRQFTRLTEFAWERTAWDLLITYLPYPDELFHLWLGYLDASLPSHDAALAARLRPFVDRGLGLVDGFVGRLAERAGPEGVLAVASDHGQVGVSRLLRPNVALLEAGLLAVGADGEIDLARTRALYFPGNSGYLVINRRERPGGIVKPEQEEVVRIELRRALLAIRDPGTDEPVVLGVIDPRDAACEPRTGGLTGGDLYLSLAPGYHVSGDHRGELISAIPPAGEHILDPQRPAMQAAFALSGPGVAANVDLGRIRQVDIAPTLCALLGIEPPAQATGEVLYRALGRLSQRVPASAE
jgi:predicted AlkP superfamily phosphohydrolase/phosphomutase